MTGKPAPMADDALELTRKCAEAMGYPTAYGNWWGKRKQGERLYVKKLNAEYRPFHDPAQAFELLCWLAERGCVMVHTSRGNFKFMPNEGETFYAGCHNPAELRLAIMRAVVKMRKDQNGR